MLQTLRAPQPHEYPGFTAGYIALVPGDGQILDHVTANTVRTEALMRSFPVEALTRPHATGEWTLLDILLHVTDNERIFAYRALRIARGDKTELPGYNQDSYAAVAGASTRSLDDLLAEYRAVRAASIALISSVDEAALDRVGSTNNGQPLSVRAAAYIIVGHELYHLRSIQENYGHLIQSA